MVICSGGVGSVGCLFMLAAISCLLDSFLLQIESKMHARRMEREAKEKEEAIAREKLRRKQGQEMVAAKAAQDEAEMKK